MSNYMRRDDDWSTICGNAIGREWNRIDDPQSVMYSTGNPRGRPHEKTAKMRNAKKRHFNFRIDADRLDELQRWAYDRGFTVAELLNTYIDSLLDEWEQNRVAEDPHHLHTIL